MIDRQPLRATLLLALLTTVSHFSSTRRAPIRPAEVVTRTLVPGAIVASSAVIEGVEPASKAPARTTTAGTRRISPGAPPVGHLVLDAALRTHVGPGRSYRSKARSAPAGSLGAKPAAQSVRAENRSPSTVQGDPTHSR